MVIKPSARHHLLIPVLLGAIVSAAVIYLGHPFIERYEVAGVSKNIADCDFKDYADLNGDGNSEELKFHRNPDMSAVQVVKDGGIIHQWNFPGAFGDPTFYAAGDIDRDGLGEVFLLTHFRDSTYIHGLRPFDPVNTVLGSRAVDRIHLRNDDHFDNLFFGPFIDLDGDGYKEVLFNIFGGLNKQPRKIYAWDVSKDILRHSPVAGTCVQGFGCSDIDGDGRCEFYGYTPAYGNIGSKDGLPFPDSLAWIMVYNDTLGYSFKPVSFGTYPGTIDLFPGPKDGNHLVGLYKGIGFRNKELKVFYLDLKGNMIRQNALPTTHGIYNAWVRAGHAGHDLLMVIYDDGTVLQLDHDLNAIDSFKVDGLIRGRPMTGIDIDDDSIEELIYPDHSVNRLRIYRNDLSFPVLIDVDDNRTIRHVAVIRAKNKPNRLFISTPDYEYSYVYNANAKYGMNYLYHILIFIVITLGFLALQYLFQRRIRLNYEAQREISQMQLDVIRSQIEPHFTLNLINSIGALFHKDEKEKAADVLERYTRLLRDVIFNSEKITIGISEELDFCRNYLELEKFRYDGKFDYSIEVGMNVVGQDRIPKMVIQTFVENAVKHGIRHLDENGMIRITVDLLTGHYRVTITDNGPGREFAWTQVGNSTGRGMLLINKMIHLYHKVQGKAMRYHIIDLHDENGVPAGTKVVLDIEF